jgi:hypothetical protein
LIVVLSIEKSGSGVSTDRINKQSENENRGK